MGYTRNAIVVNAPVADVFRLTNDIQLWPELFTEYQSADIVEQDDESVTFRLTTRPDDDGQQWSWVSRRWANNERMSTYSERTTVSLPFERMVIRWWYDAIDEQHTSMTWEQEFTLSTRAQVTEQQVTDFLNRQTRSQQKAVKQNVEKKLGVVDESSKAQDIYRGVIIARYEPGTESKLADAFRRSDETELPRRVGVVSRNLWVLGNVEVHLVEAVRPLPQIIHEFANDDLFMEIKAEADQYVKPLAPELNPGVGKEIYCWRNPGYELVPK
jgi:aromatase